MNLPLQQLLTFWGKSAADHESPSHSHPALLHMLDVGAVAHCLLEAEAWAAPACIDDDSAAIRRAIVSLVALHDIGKFTRPFQGKVPLLWPPVLGPFVAPPGSPPHDTAGYWLLTAARGIEPVALFDRWSAGQRASLWRAVAGHHGRPPLELPLNHRIDRSVACGICLAAARSTAEAIVATLDPRPLPRLSGDDVARLVWWLAGLTVLADWIGSSQRWFPPVTADRIDTLSAYWTDHALPRAARAVAEAGLASSRPAPTAGMRALFPAITSPTPLQAWAETFPIPEGPALFVVEDVTGAGKTEAALMLAHRLMQAGRAQGLFFALPTMATANAMYARLEAAYLKLFEPSATPSLVLAHARRMLNERFRDSILDLAAGSDHAVSDPADEPADAQCAAWIADDRRKTFLADVGVGTIDQALLAVLPSRHAPLRLVGLSRQLLIVDEAHAYDAYMSEELATLLRFHAALGGSAIVLSATLTRNGRQKLVAAFASGRAAECAPPRSDAYPLVTVVSDTTVTETPCGMRPGLARSVRVERVPDADGAIARIVAAARDGAAVAWVRNAVDDVLEAAAALQAHGIVPIVFHARFAMGDRLGIEERVLSTFGPPEAASVDRRGKVVVATQVIEQSLDLDFDVMVSDLAPADLLIQRAGRLWRHRRDARPVAEPRLLLVSPDPEEEIRADWLKRLLRRTSAVYRDDTLLWRSARAVLRAGAIVTPDNIRALVEEAYDDEADGAVPAALSRSYEEAQGKRGVSVGIARQNLLMLDKPYQRDAGAWDTDVRTPTRLEEQAHRVLRLARLEAGRVVPWCDHPDPRRAWALSEVSVPVSRAAKGNDATQMSEAIAAAKTNWGIWEKDIPIAVLQEVACGSLRGLAFGEVGSVFFHYSEDSGLSWASEPVPSDGG
jgi:CRISPR-associated endonuclease/helicase Cas3